MSALERIEDRIAKLALRQYDGSPREYQREMSSLFEMKRAVIAGYGIACEYCLSSAPGTGVTRMPYGREVES